MAQSRRGPAEPLSRDRIVDGALDIIDAEGLDALSMRRLGAGLGVEAMAIYHHFPNKDALLDAVAGRLVVPLATQSGGPEWQAALRESARSLRQAAGAHPRAVPLLATRALGSEAGRAWAEGPQRALRAAGFQEKDAADCFRAATAYLFGWVLLAATPAAQAASASGEGAAPVAPVAAPADRDRGFDEGLDAILDAWALRLPPGAPGAAKAAAPRGGNSDWIVQLEGGKKKAKKKGGKKRKKG